ncbi:MAG: acetyl-CoA C-acetyltransferase [Actinomycetota bacterium]
MSTIVIAGGARTPMGRFQGALSDFSAMDLGGVAIQGALERSKVAPEQVDYVIMGHVLQAAQGQITARQAAVKAGIGMDVPALTINKVCLSGLNAIALAAALIKTGEADIIVAGGMESMTNAPYALPKARAGYRMGNGTLLDLMIHDGLWCAFDACHMGEGSDKVNSVLGISRAEQDEWSARSHERAAHATKEGWLGEEIVAVSVPQRKGDPIEVTEDEGIRPGTTAESLGNLRPAFVKDGTITAGNASQVSDGAAALIVTSKEKAETLGLEILCEIVSHGQVSGPDPSLHMQPANAIRKAAAKVSLDASSFDLYEMNEAFASVAIASGKDLGVSDEKVNLQGGAVALGHPIGMSGARLVLSAAYQLQRRGGGVAAAALCGGGGQGDALIVRV